jgi:hypothetical protein
VAYLRDDDEYRAITRQTIIRGLAGVISYTPGTAVYGTEVVTQRDTNCLDLRLVGVESARQFC